MVEKLSKDLQSEFPGIKWFSPRNIRNMKSFYETYAKYEKLQPLVAEIGWVQNCIIIEKCKNYVEREFYIKKTQEKGRSKLDLIEKIQQKYFHNSLLAQNNFETTISTNLKARVAWEFIDDYNIELINPDQPISERNIENNIVENIVKFLQDMWGSFAFVGRQYKIDFEDKEYFIDLLFFNFKLNCYVIFELKAREFQPKDVWQLQMYISLVNKHVKQLTHNQTIWIIVCRDKSRTVVEYMLWETKQPIWVTTYNQHKNLPENIAKYLPTEKEIIKRLQKL